MSQLKLKPSPTKTEARPHHQERGDPTIRDHIEQLRRRYGQAEMSADEVRRIVDQAMGTNLLTEVLAETRRSNL